LVIGDLGEELTGAFHLGFRDEIPSGEVGGAAACYLIEEAAGGVERPSTKPGYEAPP
jgi:hypothetical protein